MLLVNLETIHSSLEGSVFMVQLQFMVYSSILDWLAFVQNLEVEHCFTDRSIISSLIIRCLLVSSKHLQVQQDYLWEPTQSF